ncbi:MAG: deoxyguanosinetriphosphate triphosphohydrolase, partial [Planctomycetota bacterium]|nr:deoxyguanosinetriphosphate triphosphohydrolase [Planctomycetota bacterium]
PPFGHAGEEALDEVMEGHGGFDHNLHSLRVVDFLERRYPEFRGLNLSWEVRESTVKHGGAREHLDPEFEPGWSPLLEAQLADVADSLAYTNHDIDDGLRSNFLRLEELRDIRLWKDAEEAVWTIHGPMDEKVMVARTVSYLIDRQVRDLVEATHARLEDGGIDSPEKVRDHRGDLVAFSPEMRELTDEMRTFLGERLYHHYRTLKMAGKARRFLREMFREYARDPRQLPPAYQEVVESEGVERAICDFLAGMTDRYCQEEYQRLFHPFERV